MKRTLILLSGLCLAFSTPAISETLTMKATNATGTKVMVKFFSSDRKNHMWPSSKSHFPVNAGQSANFKISCNKNEKICYGAKRDNNSNSYWGVGWDGKRCTSCCYTCNNGSFSVRFTNSAGS